ISPLTWGQTSGKPLSSRRAKSCPQSSELRTRSKEGLCNQLHSGHGNVATPKRLVGITVDQLRELAAETRKNSYVSMAAITTPFDLAPLARDANLPPSVISLLYRCSNSNQKALFGITVAHTRVYTILARSSNSLPKRSVHASITCLISIAISSRCACSRNVTSRPSVLI